MTLGIATASAQTALGAIFATGDVVFLHTGDPGAAGTANRQSTPGSKTLTWNAASGASRTVAATLPSWTNWNGTNGAVISHFSIFAADGTTFKASGILGTVGSPVTRTVNTGDTFTFTAITAAVSTVAAD
jgi:hypothetical protein